MLPLSNEDLLFRIKGGIRLEGTINKADEEGIKAGFKVAMKELLSKVNSNIFTLCNRSGPLCMWPKTHASTQPANLQDETLCKAILKYVTVEISESVRKYARKKTVKITPLKVINLQVRFELSRTDVAEKVIIQHNKMARTHFKLTLPLDVVVFANPEDTWSSLQDQFLEAVTAQLTVMDQCIQRFTKGKTVPIPQAFHFELPERTTLTTVIYPAGISEKVLEPERKVLHGELGLDNKPYLRRSMTFCFPTDENKFKYLKNVHRFIAPLNPDEFKVYLVHGSYTFHHCLQDDSNDVGWGVPYRCIQVIISWFNYQGYINIPLPTVEELQDGLTKGDEEFVNIAEIKEWPTGVQIASILKSYQISAVNYEFRTNDQPTHLISHFEEQGCPVMIFSEPKAYILLGIAVNDDPHATKHLVLDTMYTGNDEVTNVIEKAVSWKGRDFWDEMEVYGLSQPQRPEGI
ncbi:ufm1-specific protease 2-like [Scyliorhinus canicula]|uniref:ufm1-specific protease 2-like n=1 Tax=Scyliorhinus canicula TaxID=7830 RepID=UPI0018F49A4B|nr:ufm1-specific protease 2-like [Scyliorhinus canicula]